MFFFLFLLNCSELLSYCIYPWRCKAKFCSSLFKEQFVMSLLCSRSKNKFI